MLWLSYPEGPACNNQLQALNLSMAWPGKESSRVLQQHKQTMLRKSYQKVALQGENCSSSKQLREAEIKFLFLLEFQLLLSTYIGCYRKDYHVMSRDDSSIEL